MATILWSTPLRVHPVEGTASGRGLEVAEAGEGVFVGRWAPCSWEKWKLCSWGRRKMAGMKSAI
jgi:hypothetical protein